jgi:hypothetical protein
VIGGIVTIAVADSLSDALGIHIAEEAEGVHTTTEIWISTGATFVTKFLVASTFLVPVLLLDLSNAVWASVAWGMTAVVGQSWYIAHKQATNRAMVVAEHVGVAVVIVAASALVGRWVSATFG